MFNISLLTVGMAFFTLGFIAFLADSPGVMLFFEGAGKIKKALFTLIMCAFIISVAFIFYTALEALSSP